MSQEKGKVSEYLNYSAINFGNSLLMTIVTTYIMYYYSDVLLLPLGMVSVLLFMGRIFDGAIDPLFGFYMDRRHTRFGKYRGYIILGTIPVCIFYIVMFSPPRLAGTALVVYCFVIYILWTFTRSMIGCAHRPMLMTISDSPVKRRIANTVNVTAGILAALAASYLPLVLVGKLGGGSERRGFSLAMVLFALVSGVMMLYGALNLKEHNITSDNTLSVKQTISVLVHNKGLILLFAMYMCHQMGSIIKSQTMVYYMKYNMNRADLTATVMMLGVLSSFLTQPLIVWASKRVKTITLILAGYIGSCLSFVVIGISGQSVALLLVGNIFYGIASAFPANLIFIHTMDLAEGISGQNSFGGVVNSLLSLSSRLGQSLSGVIISGILSITGYVPNAEQSPLALTGIWSCLSVLTFIVFFMAVVMSEASRRMLKKQKLYLNGVE